MRVRIEDVASGRFLKPNRQWDQSIQEAKAFDGPKAAIAFCRERSLPDIRLLVTFENAEHNFYMYPFGHVELLDESQRLTAENHVLREQTLALKTELEEALRLRL